METIQKIANFIGRLSGTAYTIKPDGKVYYHPFFGKPILVEEYDGNDRKHIPLTKPYVAEKWRPYINPVGTPPEKMRDEHGFYINK